MQNAIEKMREVESFTNATLSKIVCNKRTKNVVFYIITDKRYTQEDIQQVEQILLSYLPTRWTITLDVQKSIADEQLIQSAILLFTAKQTLLSLFMQRADITTELQGNTVICKLRCTESEYSYLQNHKRILEALKESLSSQFCNQFSIECWVCNQKPNVVFATNEVEEVIECEQKTRTFTIENFEAIDKKSIDKVAIYIADCNFIAENITICGKIIDIQTRTTKTEKEYLRFTIDDQTGVIQSNYFFKKSTKEMIQSLKVGDCIVCTGKMELYNDTLSFTTQYINRGNVPQNFVPIAKMGRSVPSTYKIVHPEKIVDYNQMDLFAKEMLPQSFVENTFVVFDIETTGLINDPLTGKMDTVTEIGAVKIVGAEIVEKFSILIDPKRKLDAKIIELTGITDAMLVGQPTIDQVVGDFYKFCHGAILVAHNINFDYKFMKYYCEQENFMLENKRIDTVTFAQEVLSLANYKLNTIANHFNITFNHHRAYDDALTTAKIFIELIKLKKGLPNY